MWAVPGANSAHGTPATATAPLREVSACELEPLPLRLPAAARVVAIGDLHGDLEVTRAVFRLAGAIDGEDRWIGGSLVVVQIGDILDRGDDEQAILDLLERLALEAKEAGGAVILLLGNHELMNATFDLRYVTPGGFRDFEDVEGLDRSAPELAGLPASARARAAAFRPGGPYAKLLARSRTAVIVGDTLFVHGGVEPAYALRLAAINHAVRCWLDGAGELPPAIERRDGLLWSRAYSTAKARCDELARTLELVDTRRMIVGHTPQGRINEACGGAVWRIDVGMTRYYGGPVQALELRGGLVRVLEAL